MNNHFVEPDYFLISYWPGSEPDDNIQTVKTSRECAVNL